MKVLGKFILIKPTPEKEEDRGGFLIAASDVAKERYKEATVIQAGVDVASVKKDDIIVFENSDGHDVKINGEFFTLIQERSVSLILN
jgi:co-chaperonin GroES (HSP10)